MKKMIVFLILFLSVLNALEYYTPIQKQKYIYPLGKKISQYVCHDIKKEQFYSPRDLYRFIDAHCHLDQKRYKEALTWYLWDAPSLKHNTIVFSYTKKTKCPVCGMFIYKYPSWATMMQVDNQKLFFDGVKDMMKYYFSLGESKKKTSTLYVMDYYSKEIFDLKKGYVVIGSDIYGPMGEELIPFQKLRDAKHFMLDHQGEHIYRFAELTYKIVKALDE